MPVMNFDLEDGQPPVSFSLKPQDCERMVAFMNECQALKMRKWVDLTLADMQAILDDNYGGSRADVIDKAIKLFKEKNA